MEKLNVTDLEEEQEVSATARRVVSRLCCSPRYRLRLAFDRAGACVDAEICLLLWSELQTLLFTCM